MSDLTLYEITNQFAEIANLDELGEEELVALNGINLALSEKAANIVSITDNLESFISLCDSESKRITARKKAAANKLAWLNDYVKQGMQVAGLSKIEIGTRSISLQNNPPKVIIDDESQIPAKFLVIIPESYKVDKDNIKKILKNGEAIPGVHLETGISLRKR